MADFLDGTVSRRARCAVGRGNLPLHRRVQTQPDIVDFDTMSTQLTVSSLVCALALVWLCLAVRLSDLALLSA